MAIVFDEVTADVTPPAPTPGTNERRGENSACPPVDPQSLLRELQRLADRAARLNAD